MGGNRNIDYYKDLFIYIYIDYLLFCCIRGYVMIDYFY